jgi:hypothetical protein
MIPTAVGTGGFSLQLTKQIPSSAWECLHRKLCFKKDDVACNNFAARIKKVEFQGNSCLVLVHPG